MKTELTTMLAAILIAASCSDQGKIPKQDIQDDEKRPLTLSVIAASDVSKSLITGSSLNDGATIGVSLADAQGGTYDGGTYSNIKFTSEGNGNSQRWNPAHDIMLSSSKAVLYAYYPYSDKADDISCIPVKADSDNQTDYMYATPVTDINNHNSEAVVQLKHALAAVRICVSRGTYTGRGNITGISIKGDNIATEGILDGTTGKLYDLEGTGAIISPAISSVTLYDDPISFDILAIPNGRQCSMEIGITMDGESFSTATDIIKLQQGTVSVIDVSINNNSVTVVPVRVSAWTTSNAGSSSLGDTWSVNLTGDRDGISFSNSIEEDGSVRIVASPELYGAEVNPVTITEGNAEFSESLDEETGTRTITLSGISSDIDLEFSSYSIWVTATYNITSTTSATILLSTESNRNRTLCQRMKVDGTEVTAANYHTFASIGEHTVKFSFPDKAAIPESAFSTNDNLISLTIPEGVTKINSYSISGCKNLVSVSLPQTLTSSGYDAISGNKSLKSIELPDNLVIGSRFLYGCTALESIVLPKNLKSIPESMLAECSSLKQIAIPESVTAVGEKAFDNTGLTSLILPDRITEVPKRLCHSCDYLESISLPSGIRSIGESAFMYCSSLRLIKTGNNGNESSIDMPEGITSVGKQAFHGCDLMTSVRIPSSLTAIGHAAFCTDGISSVIVDKSNPEYEAPDGFNGIIEKDTGVLIFGCRTAEKVPETVTQIGAYAYYTIPIKSIDLHEDITYVGDYAFNNTSTLKSIISRSVIPPQTGTRNIFNNPASQGRLKVLSEAVEAYKTSSWMGTSSGFLGFPNYKWSVEAIAE